jgi:hypothetical protein
MAFAMRHTFDSVAWHTWGDSPVLALAALFESGLDSQVGGDEGKQGLIWYLNPFYLIRLHFSTL